VLALLDAYGEGWVQEHHAACTATRVLGTQSTEVMEQRIACLSSARRRFGALVEVLAEPDAAVAERAVAAVSELPPVARCADELHVASRAPPAEPDAARRVEALREELDVAIAWHDAGRYALARERFAALVERAEPLGHRPLSAEARLWLGMAHDAMGETEAAVRAHQAAFFDARAAGDDEVAARAALRLVYEEGYRHHRYEAADAWAEHARASLERLGDDPLEPELHMAVANVDLARGRYADARAGHQRAVDGFTAQLGPTHPRVTLALGNLALAELRLGKPAAAAALGQRVLELTTESVGASHPQVSIATSNLAGAYYMMGRYDDALAQYRVALAIDEAVLGPRHPDIVSTRSNIANTYAMLGDLERALAEQREILALVRELYGDDSVELADSLSNAAVALRGLGRGEAAMEALRRAVSIVEQRLPASHPEVASLLHNLALVEDEQGRRDAALEHARRALAIREQILPPLHHDRSASHLLLSEILRARGELAEARVAAETALAIREQGTPPSVGALASARMQVARLLPLQETGGDRARACALARQARDEFVADGWTEDHAEEWLALAACGHDAGPGTR
jgi:tetratricopeptide (TPR) repeat protein